MNATENATAAEIATDKSKPLPKKLSPSQRKAMLEIIEKNRKDGHPPAEVLFKDEDVKEWAWGELQKENAKEKAAAKAFLESFSKKPTEKIVTGAPVAAVEPKLETKTETDSTNNIIAFPVTQKPEQAVKPITATPAAKQEKNVTTLSKEAVQELIKKNFGLILPDWVFETKENTSSLRLWLCDQIKPIQQERHRSQNYTAKIEGDWVQKHTATLNGRCDKLQNMINAVNSVLSDYYGVPKDHFGRIDPPRVSRDESATIKLLMLKDPTLAWIFDVTVSFEEREKEVEFEQEQEKANEQRKLEEAEKAKAGSAKNQERKQRIDEIVQRLLVVEYFTQLLRTDLERIAEQIIKKCSADSIEKMLEHKAIGVYKYATSLRSQNNEEGAKQRMFEAYAYAEAVKITPEALDKLYAEGEKPTMPYSQTRVDFDAQKKQENATAAAKKAKEEKKNKKKGKQ